MITYYVLTEDVTNPAADRRFKGDPKYRPVWRAGMRFAVGPFIQLADGRSVNGIKFHERFMVIPERDERFALIMASATPVEETFEEWADRTHVGSYTFELLEKLVLSGATTKEQLEAWALELYGTEV